MKNTPGGKRPGYCAPDIIVLRERGKKMPKMCDDFPGTKFGMGVQHGALEGMTTGNEEHEAEWVSAGGLGALACMVTTQC
eukprot:1153814-Pelagomonas_calceolata.AAC.6